LSFHAHKSESTSQTPSLNHIEMSLYGKTGVLNREDARRILLAMGVYESICNVACEAREPQLGSLVIAVCACLPLSVEEKLKSHTQLAIRHGGLLLRAAISDTSYFQIDDLEASVRIIKLLLDTGIKADSVFDCDTPFSRLINFEQTSDEFTVHGDVFNGTQTRAELLSILLIYGANPNQMIRGFPRPGGFAPSTTVVLTEEDPGIVLKVLLSYGADTSVEDSEGFTSLFYAIAWGEISAVNILLDYGADPCYLNSRGLSALCPKPDCFTENTFELTFEGFVSQCHSMSYLFRPRTQENPND
jgi:hypothetical protein